MESLNRDAQGEGRECRERNEVTQSSWLRQTSSDKVHGDSGEGKGVTGKRRNGMKARSRTRRGEGDQDQCKGLYES